MLNAHIAAQKRFFFCAVITMLGKSSLFICVGRTDAVMVPCCHIMCRGCALTALQQAQAASSLPAAATEYPCPVCRHPFTKVTLLALPGAARLPQRIIDCLFDDEGQFHYSSKLKSLHQYLQKDNAVRCKLFNNAICSVLKKRTRLINVPC